MKKQFETIGRDRRKNDFVQFVGNSFRRHNGNALLHFDDRIEGIGLDIKVELACEPDCTHHAERVVGEGNFRFERVCGLSFFGDLSFLQMDRSVRQNCRGSRLIPIALIVKSRRFWSSLRVPSSTAGLRESAVRLFSGRRQTLFPGRPDGSGLYQIFENTYKNIRSQLAGHQFGQLNPASNGNNINILAIPFEYQVPNETTDHICLHTQLRRGRATISRTG
jgi:hypothetical protein